MAAISRDDLLAQLRWRYAVKKFDPERKISAADWEALKTSMHLAPSSFGLQPWRFIVIRKQAVRQALRAASWGQSQTTDCSHLVVMAAKQVIDTEHVDRFMSQVASIRSLELTSLTGYRQVILKFVEAMPAQAIAAWTSRQVYIALGQLMTAAAMLGIDSCPMEGIEPREYDRILGLQDSGYATVVACALGYRAADDHSAKSPKVRFDVHDVFEHYDDE